MTSGSLYSLVNSVNNYSFLTFFPAAAGKKRTKAGKTGVNAPSVNPRSHRRNTMESSTKDQAEGKDEKGAGKIRQKIDEIEKVVGK